MPPICWVSALRSENKIATNGAACSAIEQPGFRRFICYKSLACPSLHRTYCILTATLPVLYWEKGRVTWKDVISEAWKMKCGDRGRTTRGGLLRDNFVEIWVTVLKRTWLSRNSFKIGLSVINSSLIQDNQFISSIIRTPQLVTFQIILFLSVY